MSTLYKNITETVTALKNGSRRLNEKNLIRLAEDTIVQSGILSERRNETDLVVKVHFRDGSKSVYDFRYVLEANRIILDLEQYATNDITLFH